MFGMSLERDLHDLEVSDPKVRAASKRMDETMESLRFRMEVDPDVRRATRKAALDVIAERMEACDQRGTEVAIVAAQRRGHHLEQADFDKIGETLTPEAQKFWASPCPCGLDIEHVH